VLPLDGLKQDLTYSLRTMVKSPGFTVVALFTLVLGIGATTAIFSVVNAVLLRPLAYRDPERLVHVLANGPGDTRAGVSYESFQTWRSQNRTFTGLAAYYRNSGWSRVTIGGSVEPQSGQAGFVSADLFSVLGVVPLIGRVFDEAEERHHVLVAILSGKLWEQYFGGDPSALGRTIEVDGRALTIIGVMPRAFQFPAPETLLWLPITTNRYWSDRPQRDSVHTRGFYMRWSLVGRLRADATPDTALADIATLGSQLSRENPDWNMGLEMRVTALEVEIGGNARLALLALFGSASLVLLIACSNVANLMLARGAARARELAIRSALGATQGRIIRQVLSEGLVLAVSSASLAVLLAMAALRLLLRFGPMDLPRLEETRMDGPVLCFTLGLAVLATLLFAILPALQASRSNPVDAMGTGGRSFTAGPTPMQMGALLVVVEFALAVALLAGAGLLLRSLQAIERVDLGFSPDGVLTMRVRLPNGTPVNRHAAFQEIVQTRLAALPGVRFVGGVSGLFELDRAPLNSLRVIEGRVSEQDTSRPLTWTTVSGEYFRAMGIPLLAGRCFSSRDTADAPLVAIIDEAAAQRFWPNENPLGKRFKGQDARGRNDDWLTVVGVVKGARRQGLEQEPTPHVYEWSQQANSTTDWVIRTTGNPTGYASSVRAVVREAEPRAAISNLMDLRTQLDLQTATRRFRTWLLGLFAAVAIVLAAVGIYGVLSYATGRRTQEIGIRMALGAQRSGILWLILRQGLVLAAVGLVAGTTAAIALTRLISGLLFGVTPADPLTFAAVAAILLAVAVAATLLPALRATGIDPLSALRAE